MNHEFELKIQAYVDGELPAGERRKVAELIDGDADARALCDALSAARTLLRENEPEHKVPESREFYWSKIERAIQAQPADAEPAVSGALSWTRWWPRFALSGAAAALLLGLLLAGPWSGRTLLSKHYSHEIESPLENVSAITFHSESANMTVVWVQTQ